MTNKEIKENIVEQAQELENLLTERISELYNLAGAAQGQFYQGARHTFCYYRDFLWKIRDLAREIKEFKPMEKK
ncbi:MAG: hypothetical protein IPJ03_16155 [Ignavibacteriales bacterium]|nr:hypothetical protein [Ignavibacteriales bacterium]